MAGFTSVIIIYNPNSKGNSKANAKNLEKHLKKALPHIPVKNIPTEYAGHAEELAYDAAKAYKCPLIVSSSGDGGYHEVINGVMRTGSKARSTICAVLPAGNANDHSRTLQHKPLWKSIRKGTASRIDLLKISISNPDEESQIRYAHSYAGLGLTPVIATELNRHTLNAFKEASLVIRMFFKYHPFEIRHGSRTMSFDSLIFANINKMAKVLTLARKNQPDDGKFEIISFPHSRKLILIKKVLRAATIGLKTTTRAHTYSFTVVKDMPMQLDGEVTALSAGSKIEITAARKILRTIV